jgi:molybdopterin molybdotransferase
VPALTFPEARATVLREAQAALKPPAVETAMLGATQGRILAEDILADRDYPPFNRSVRDGFAVLASDLPGTVRVIGEVRAGEAFGGKVSPGQAVEIMTGAPLPQGADAVVMVENCRRNGDGTVSTDSRLAPGTNIAARGCEAPSQAAILARGTRIDYTGVSWLATTGHPQVKVFARPRVAIVATGDEIVEVGEQPAPNQIRNSNAWSLAAQVERAGAIPIILPIARDTRSETRRLIEQGLDADVLVLSGGVSAGKYDVVELALADLGAEFFFDRVLIQPGQPLVFGRARGRFFFGLPGNPASTMVTFELFARAAIELAGGANEAPLRLTLARLTRPFHHKTGLTRFLPAHISCTEVTPVDWQGSGDVPALCRANAFLVADANQPEYKEGDLIPVLPK